MTKKEYCFNHNPIASHDYFVSHIHGIEYGIEDYVFVSESIQPRYCGAYEWRFHKCKIYTDVNGEMYFNIVQHDYDGEKHVQRRNINSYIRRGEWLPNITSSEIFGED